MCSVLCWPDGQETSEISREGCFRSESRNLVAVGSSMCSSVVCVDLLWLGHFVPHTECVIMYYCKEEEGDVYVPYIVPLLRVEFYL